MPDMRPGQRPGQGRSVERGTALGLRIALWVLFAGSVLAGGVLMLRACGIRQVFGFARNYCPAPSDGAFAREVETGESLRRQVHVAEMSQAEVPPCTAPAVQPSIRQPSTGRPTATPEPTPEERAESQAIDKRVEQRGGKTGRLQFTLAWATLDDLDLNVTCPGGRISSFDGERGPGICGDGVKDIDANRNLKTNVSTTPVENVVWTDSYPDGRYIIDVIEYRSVTDGANRVPFTLRMRLGDQESECHGAVTQLAPRDMVKRDGQLESGTAQQLSWTGGEPLPSCDFTLVTTVRTPRSK